MRVEIPEPCGEDWAQMSSEDRGRRCAKCRTTVHDLAQYTPEEAETVISAGACVRAEVLPGGRIATRPSRVGRVLLAAVTAPALLALAACMQGKPNTAMDADTATPSSSAEPATATPASDASAAEQK